MKVHVFKDLSTEEDGLVDDVVFATGDAPERMTCSQLTTVEGLAFRYGSCLEGSGNTDAAH